MIAAPAMADENPPKPDALNPNPLNPSPMWLAGPPPEPDTYAGFRGTFTLDRDARVDLLIWGESWFVLAVDGQFAAEGPTRSEAGEHEAVAVSLDLKGGKHV